MAGGAAAQKTMKLFRFLSALTVCALLVGFTAGCGDPKIHLDSESKDTHPPKSTTPILSGSQEHTTPQAPDTEPTPPEDPFFNIYYLSHNVREGMYVIVGENNLLSSSYQYQLENIKSSFGDTPIVLKQSDMLLNPMAIKGLRQLCLAFYEAFGTDHRYLPLIQNAYDGSDRASEHATGYALDFHFWDTKTELVYDLGNLAVSAETELIRNHLAECGFTTRYSDMPEHLRYVGTEFAVSLRDADMTFDAFVSEIVNHTHITPLEFSGYIAYSVRVSDKMTTGIPLPRGTEDYFVTGLNNRYFVVLMPQSTPIT